MNRIDDDYICGRYINYNSGSQRRKENFQKLKSDTTGSVKPCCRTLNIKAPHQEYQTLAAKLDDNIAENTQHVVARDQLLSDSRLTLAQVEDRYKQVNSMFVKWTAADFFYRRIKPLPQGLMKAILRTRSFALQPNIC